MRFLVQALVAVTTAASDHGEEVARLVGELAAPTRAARLEAQEALLALPGEAVPLLAQAVPPPGFEPRAALRYALSHRPRAPRPVKVPAGSYRVGSPFVPDQNPPREVTLEAFSIDDVEVTCFQWWRFTRATGSSLPPDWLAGRYGYGGESLPVANVAPEEAARFAEWVGGRLPTADEWEVAAHGGTCRPFPWGEEFDGHLTHQPLRRFFSVAAPEVGSEEDDRSPFGGHDFCSSLSEWVTLPDGRFAARGGSFLSGGKEFLRLTRAPDPRLTRRRPVVGVRVVGRTP